MNLKPWRERFWEKVDVRGPDECWEWQASKYVAGYGKFNTHQPGTSTIGGYAHRASWVIHFGPIPKGSKRHDFCILHTCDNPPCVNPRHLRLGTQTENVADRDKKGRGHVWGNGLVHVKLCPICGSEFEATSPLRKYDTEECARRARVHQSQLKEPGTIIQ